MLHWIISPSRCRLRTIIPIVVEQNLTLDFLFFTLNMRLFSRARKQLPSTESKHVIVIISIACRQVLYNNWLSRVWGRKEKYRCLCFNIFLIGLVFPKTFSLVDFSGSCLDQRVLPWMDRGKPKWERSVICLRMSELLFSPFSSPPSQLRIGRCHCQTCLPAKKRSLHTLS